MKKLIIVPAFNEEKNIIEVVNDIKKYAVDFDYIVINDSSIDRTQEICKDNNINIVTLPINLGIGGAMQTGYKYASNNHYDIAVQTDGDGQHDISYLNKLITYIESNQADIVIGSRFIDKEGFQSTFARRTGIKYFQKLLKLCSGLNITDATSGFRACNKNVIEYFSYNYPKDYPEPESVMTLSREGFRIKEIPVVMKERTGGISSIRSFKTVYYMIKVTIAIIIAAIKPIKRKGGGSLNDN